MDLSAIIARHFFLFLSALVCCIALLRARRKRTNPNRKKRRRLAGAFLGNALMPLHAIIHPHTKHAVVQMLDEQTDGDQDTDPADPAQHFERQLKRIRNGEDLDQITTRLR
ncbi:MAG TPA: hypothetical protein VME86_12980 [Acidobacteriaceae bacterium]|nr:hypothetical protein [Acidobacteriaceae bacterium]